MKPSQRLRAIGVYAVLACAVDLPAGALGGDIGGNTSPASALTPPSDRSDTARIQAGKKRFNAACAAYRHGAEGEGGKTPPFKGNKDFTAAAAFQVITEGRRGSDEMPPWGKVFTPEQILELVSRLDHLSKQQVSR